MGERRAQRLPSRARDEQVVANGLRLVVRDLHLELDAKDAVILQQQTKIARQAKELAHMLDRTRIDKQRLETRWHYDARFARIRMTPGQDCPRMRIPRNVFRWYKVFIERWGETDGCHTDGR